MSRSLASLAAMGDALDAIEASPAPAVHVKPSRLDTAINAAPLVLAYMLASWADGWASAPLITTPAG